MQRTIWTTAKHTDNAVAMSAIDFVCVFAGKGNTTDTVKLHIYRRALQV